MSRFKNSPIVTILLVVFAAVVGYAAYNISRQAFTLGGEAEDARRKIEELTQKKKELEAYLEEIQTRQAAEREAKQRLNLKLPGEEVVVVEEPQISSPENQEMGFWGRIRAFLGRFLP